MKNNMEILTDKLHLVDIRFYKKEYGVELPNEELTPKAIIYENNGEYANVITGEKLPFLTKSPYTNSTKSGVSYGTKLFVKTPDMIEAEGICYVEIENAMIDEIKKDSIIKYHNLEEKILYSKLYFKDRIRIIEERVDNGIQPRKMKKLAKIDWEKNCVFKEKLDELKISTKQLIK